MFEFSLTSLLVVFEVCRNLAFSLFALAVVLGVMRLGAILIDAVEAWHFHRRR